VTSAKRYDESVDEYGHLLIRPNPSCPECVAIMAWRSGHRGIAISNGAEIRLSDASWGSRHLHMSDVRVAHLKRRAGGNGTEDEGALAPSGAASVVLVTEAGRISYLELRR